MQTPRLELRPMVEDDLDALVETLARRIASYDKESIAAVKQQIQIQAAILQREEQDVLEAVRDLGARQEQQGMVDIVGGCCGTTPWRRGRHPDRVGEASDPGAVRREGATTVPLVKRPERGSEDPIA